ncbi:hypothetical protein ABPG72_007636 [Tetrahymena utriculariae]
MNPTLAMLNNKYQTESVYQQDTNLMDVTVVGLKKLFNIKIPYDAPKYYPEGQYVNLDQTSDALKAAIAKAPVSVCVDASIWKFYKSGIFRGCSPTTEDDLNHAIIAVGYDADGNWIIRNSWATKWGENGYIRLTAGNTCGVLLSNIAFDNQQKIFYWIRELSPKTKPVTTWFNSQIIVNFQII